MKQNDRRLQAYKRVLGGNLSGADGTEKTPEQPSVKKAEFPRFTKEETARSSEPVPGGMSGQETVPSGGESRGNSSVQDGLFKVPGKNTAPQAGADRGNAGSDSAYRRVAKFLLLIGTDEAAKVIAHLTPEQTERIIPEIASIRHVDKDEAAVILAEFENLLQRARESGGVETAKSILEKAFGEKKAADMMEKAVPFAAGKPFEYLEDMDSDRLFFLLKDESAPVKALVLSRINPSRAAAVIQRMSAGDKKETVRRLAKLTAVSPDILRRIDEAMREKVQNTNAATAESIDGRSALAEIMRRMEPSAENGILASLAESDPDLGKDLRERLFTIDDVVRCDDRYMQTKLRSMSDQDIAVLIAGKTEEFRAKIFSCISKTRGAAVLEEEALLKPVPRKDSDIVTGRFLSDLRRAWEEGRLIVEDRDSGEYVV